MAKDNIRYFDMNVILGAGSWTSPGQPVTAERLLDEMDHTGIHEALVMDSRAEIGSADEANRRIIDKTRDHPRLHPVWSILPTASREMPPPDEFVAGMKEFGVPAARLNYGAFAIPLEDWAISDIIAPLEAERIPLILSPIDMKNGVRDDINDWPAIVRFCRDYPKLPVIVTESRVYQSQRQMLQALAACPNLTLDLSAPWLQGMIEFICREFGAERLVWGSRLPYNNPSVPVMRLNYALIEDVELAQIAGGNLYDLFRWNPNFKPAAGVVEFPEPIDDLHRAARERADLSGEGFYDCHGHVNLIGRNHSVSWGAEGSIKEMDRCGVKLCCIFSSIADGEMTLANEHTFKAVADHPDRYAGFTFINVNRSAEEIEAEILRGIDNGMIGIKMLSSMHRYPHGGPNIELACRLAHEHKLFFLNHSWGPSEVLERLVSSYPNALFITGHTSLDYGEQVEKYPNLYICSCPFLTYGSVEEHVKVYGAERILFGSDLQDLPIAWGMAPIFYARISEPDKRLIMGENLKRLLAERGLL